MPLFGKEDPRGVPEYSEICPDPFELSESEPRPNSDDGTPLTVAPPTLHYPYLPQNVSPTDWDATEAFTRRANNALGLVFPPFQMHADEASAVVTSTPQAESLRAPSNRQDIRGRERMNQKRYAPREQTIPQSHVTANEVLAQGFQQDTCLRDVMNNVSDSEPKKTAASSQKAHSYKRLPKARKNYGPDDWLSSGELKERADNRDVLSTCAEYAEEPNNKLLYAPLRLPVALPDDDDL